MNETADAVKKVDDVDTNTDSNSGNGTDDHSTSDNKAGSVPLATFLGMKDTVKQLEGKIKQMEDTKKAEADAKLLEDGKLQELIDSTKIELAETKSKLEAAESEAEESKTFRGAKIEEYKKKLGDKWQEDYSNLSLIALDKLTSQLLGVKPSPATDKGATGEHTEVELTAEQKKEAELMFPYAPKEKAWEFHKHNLIKLGTIKTEK